MIESMDLAGDERQCGFGYPGKYPQHHAARLVDQEGAFLFTHANPRSDISGEPSRHSRMALGGFLAFTCLSVP